MIQQAPAPGVGWQGSAACGGTNSRTFFEASPAEAKKICGGCPVRPECLYDAVDTDARDGIWGGFTRRERRALPVLPTDRTAAINVLRQLLTFAAAPEPVKPKAIPAPREDVAALLRGGATQAQIMKHLKVSQRVITATREAYDIPRPTGAGFRYSPERRAENERRTIELLRGGATYQQITDEVGISAPTILAICRKAGLPTPDNNGGQPARTKAEALALHLEAYGDGHARWNGPMTGRLPQLYAEKTRFNARHVVFEQHHGRPPVGRLRSDCGVTACMAGAHLTDHVLRTALPKEEPPVTVQGLKKLLDEIDEQGGPQAARTNRLTLPSERTPESMTTAPAPSPAPPVADVPLKTAADVRLQPVAQDTDEALSIGDLLKWGEEHLDPDVQDQAARARAALAGLRVRHAANQELTEILTEVEQLEERLAELRSREAVLVPAKKPAPAKKAQRKSSPDVRSYDSSTVRAWAAANGVDCPRFGKISQRVLNAWREATSSS